MDDGSNGPDSDPDNNSDTDVDSVVQLPFLRVFKSASMASSGDAFRPGDPVTWTITIENIGGADAVGVGLTDQMPVYTVYLSGTMALDGFSLTDDADADAGTYEGFSTTIVVDVGTIPVGGSRSVSFTTTIGTDAPYGGVAISNQAYVDSSGETYPSDDPDTFDEDDPTEITVIAVGIPMLGLPSQLVLVLLMAMAGLLIMKRN